MSALLFPVWWFWLCFLGICVGIAIFIYRFKLKLFEIVDAVVAGLFPWLIFLYLADSAGTKSVFSLGGFFILLAIYLFYRYIDVRYKRFVWYRSGRVGFSALAVLGILFVLRSLAGFANVDMLSFVGKADIYISAIVSFLVFFGMYHLARKIG